MPTKTEKQCESRPEFCIMLGDIQECIALFKVLGFTRLPFDKGCIETR